MKVRFKNSKGGSLAGYLYKPLTRTDSAVIVCHGFSGFKEVFRAAGRYIAFNGFIFLAFDFTGNGESDGLFTEGTISQEISDVISAVDFLKKNYGVKKIALVGHSLGGAVAILAASKNKGIDCVVALAPLAELQGKDYKKYANEMADLWDSKGLCEIVKCKKMRVLDTKFFYDIKNYDVIKAVKKLRIPLLVVHGDADSIINISEGESIYKNASSKIKHFHVLRGVNHYFIKDRWQTLHAVSSWLKKCLK